MRELNMSKKNKRNEGVNVDYSLRDKITDNIFH